MFGHPFLLPVPDIDRTKYFLILGANPLASNGSLMTSPDIVNRMNAIKRRGGKIVLIDPRRNETARVADEHHFIRPNTDAFFLLSIINILFEENLIDPCQLADFTDGFDAIRNLATRVTPDLAAERTGIPSGEIKRIAREFAASGASVCYGRIGLSTQRFGGLCQWLINVINIITGNFDREGGAMFTTPAFDLLMASKGYEKYGRWKSRVRGLEEFLGELPVAAMAEEILTGGEGQIKALVTSCGNPVLSTPNGKQLDAALEKLEFMVAIDFYVNETTRHADIILPPVTNLESSHYDIVFNTFAVRNTAKYSPPLFAKSDDARYDWQIFQELGRRLGDSNGEYKPEPPEVKLSMGLMFGGSGVSLDTLKENPHGVDLGALRSCMPERLKTSNKRIDLAPEMLVKDVDRLLTSGDESREFPFTLIGRRHLRDCNSWMHNYEVLVKGKNRCTVMINESDASALGVTNGEQVKVTSRAGSIELPCEVTENIAPGVVSIPHGYGHNYNGTIATTAADHAGASINDLTDELVLDELTGNAAFSGVGVQIRHLPEA
jgi:anaerobic selenocysteine-containing dehydrogenase